MSEIKKITDQRKTQNSKGCKKKTRNKDKKTRVVGGAAGGRGRNYRERVRAKWFCCTFKLGFFQLICKVSLVFKSSLELVSSIIFKQSKLYESKTCAGGV